MHPDDATDRRIDAIAMTQIIPTYILCRPTYTYSKTSIFFARIIARPPRFPRCLCSFFAANTEQHATMADNDARSAAAAADDDDNSDVEMSGECYDGLRVCRGV